MIDGSKQALKSKFAVKELDELKYYVDIEIYRKRENKGTIMSQGFAYRTAKMCPTTGS